MAVAWEKADPDQVFDDLPEPYRSINKVIDEILLGVDESIKAVESKRKSASYEFDLPQALPTTSLPVLGTVTSAFAETRAAGRLAIGTSLGEVAVIEARSCEVVASERPPFAEGESARCVALSADAVYHSIYTSTPQLAQAWQGPPRPSPKLMVAGSVTPQIFVYSLIRDSLAHGLSLVPACAIDVPAPEVTATKVAAAEAVPDPKAKKGAPTPVAAAADEPEEPAVRPPPVEQLHVRGTQGGIWVIALLWDRTIRAYLCPLGQPENAVQAKQESMTDIPEEQEVDADAAPTGGEEFAKVPRISTPKYCISMPSMVAMPGLSEPILDNITLSVFAPRPSGARSRTAGTVPTLCYLTSRDSNLVLAYSFRTPAFPTGAEPAEGTDAEKVDALLTQKAPPMGEMKEPSEALSLAPQRRWMMPAQTTAVAVAPSGGSFVAGGSQGTIALINTTAGPSLKAVLSGHYAAVTGLSFHKSEVLVSVGADSWVHFYDIARNSLLARTLLSPPPTPPPATCVVALPFAPLGLALDASGNLRLLDLHRVGKLARAFCQDPLDFGQSGVVEEPMAVDAEVVAVGPSLEQAPPSQVLATSSGFCVVCNTRTPAPSATETPPAAEEPAADPPPAEAAVEAAPAEEQAEAKVEDNSWLVFFDQASTLCSLFPGIASRVENGESALELFKTLSKEEMIKASPAEPLGMLGTGAAATGSTVNAKAQRSTSKLSLAESQKTIAPSPLTAENLQKIGKPASIKAPSERRSVLGVSDAGGSSKIGRRASKGNPAQLGQATAEHSQQAVPEFWQVGVRRNLRRCLEYKQVRQATIHKHMEAMRKEVEGT